MKLLKTDCQPLTGSRRSFTLVELLVVIAIIAILAAVIMLAINPIEMMRKARDSTRLQDLENVRKAIDMAIASEGAAVPNTVNVYQSNTSPNQSCSTTSCGTGANYSWVCGGINICTFLAALPRDPVNNANYFYAFRANGTNYELNAILESSSAEAQNKMRNDGGDDPNRYEIGTALNLISP